MTMRCSPPLYLTRSTWPSTPATVVSTVALVMVVPGRFQGRWPSPVPRCTSAKIITRIAFWLPSACGIAPTPMKAPGLMSASVAWTTPNTADLVGQRHALLVALAAGLTTMVGPSTPTIVPTTRTVFCCACADVTTSTTASAAIGSVVLPRYPDR